MKKLLATQRMSLLGIFLTLICRLNGAETITHPADSIPNPETTIEDKTPFVWGDFTWIQGNSRQSYSLLSTPNFIGSITMDCNYNYSFHQPVDHTTSGSTATFRSNEFNISYIEAGGEFSEPVSGVRGKLLLQFGTRATGIPRNDNSPLRGQFDLYNALRYVTEGMPEFIFEKCMVSILMWAFSNHMLDCCRIIILKIGIINPLYQR
jgi:hypothetical protein